MITGTGNRNESEHDSRECRKRMLSQSENDSHHQDRRPRRHSDVEGHNRELYPRRTSSPSRTSSEVRGSRNTVRVPRSSSPFRYREHHEHTRSRRSDDYVEQHRAEVGHGTDRSRPSSHARESHREEPHLVRSMINKVGSVISRTVGSQGQGRKTDWEAQNYNDAKSIKASMSEAIRKLKEENQQLENNNKELQEENSKLDKGVRKHKRNYEDAAREREDYFKQSRSYETELQRTQQELAHLRNTKGFLETELMQKTTLLETRTIELRTAETFLSKYDEIPGDEVVSLVSNLNQLVLGIAEKCCDLFSFQKTIQGREKSSDEVEKLNQIRSIIGSPLIDFLLSKDHTEDPTIVQLAMQATLLLLLYNVIEYWPTSLHSDSFCKTYSDLYSLIHENEIQAVAARWRALGSKHLRVGLGINVNRMVPECIRRLKVILQVSGAQVDTSSEGIMEQLKDDLERLWSSAGSIAEKIKESVLSTDYKLIFIHPGSSFDESYAKSQGLVKKQSPVLCSTELGLARVTNVGSSGSTSGELERKVILKATVIFEHEIAEIFA